MPDEAVTPVPIDADARQGRRRATVTIILTNYNHAKFLDCSLSAIAGQTRPADEVIVIDDGSTDNSLQIIRHFAAQHDNVRVIVNERNRGAQYSIARAIGAVTSDWLAWAAADDKLLPGFVERGVAMIEQHPGAGVVFSQLATFMDGTNEETHYGDHENRSSAFYIGPGPTYFSPDAMMERLTRGYMWLSGNTALVRRSCLFDVGAFVPALEWHSDWFAFYAAALRYGACGIPENLAMMRVLPTTYSAAGMKDPVKQGRVMSSVLDLLQERSFADLRRKFRARPCLFSAFPFPMMKAMAKRPRDWDLFIRLVSWAVDHLRIRCVNRLAHVRWPRGVRTRVVHILAALATRVLARITPETWKEAEARGRA